LSYEVKCELWKVAIIVELHEVY